MIVAPKYTNHLSAVETIVQSLNVTTTETDKVYPASTVPIVLPMRASGDQNAAVVGFNSIKLGALGVPLYANGAAWPQCRGTTDNSMSGASALAGPGNSVTWTAMTQVVPGLSFKDSSLAIDAGNNVYAVSTSGTDATLHKFSTAAGTYTQLWSKTVPFVVTNGSTIYPLFYANAFTPVLGRNNTVIFLASSGLYCVDALTGVEKWSNSFSNFLTNPQANVLIDGRGNIYCSAQSQIFCTSPAGVMRWEAFLPCYVCALSLDHDTGILYVVTAGYSAKFLPGPLAPPGTQEQGAQLQLFDSRTGTQMQTAAQGVLLPTDSRVLSSIQCPIVGNDLVYLYTGYYIAAFTKLGTLAWSLQLNNAVNGMVYNPRLNRLYITKVTDATATVPQTLAVVALNGATGITVNSSALVSTNNFTGQPIIDGNDNVYVYESTANTIHVYNSTLTLLKSIVVPLTFANAPPFALNNTSQLLVTSDQGIFASNN